LTVKNLNFASQPSIFYSKTSRTNEENHYVTIPVSEIFFTSDYLWYD